MFSSGNIEVPMGFRFWRAIHHFIASLLYLFIMNSSLLPLLLLLLLSSHTRAFLSNRHRLPNSFLLLAKRKKLSAAEKRKRRAQKQVSHTIQTRKPVSFKEETVQVETEAADAVDQEVEGKAQQLLEAQRQSVAMLTRVKEAVESIDVSELERKGYMVVDDLLEDLDGLERLAVEGQGMLVEHGQMTADVERLGSAEYITRLKGGQEQYQYCPRAIEWVVSCTKHFPVAHVDRTQTMAFMRTFDRKAYLASLQLLTGSIDDGGGKSDAPFGLVVDGDDDRRIISMRYYLNSDSGSNLTFETTGETVAAARDRLIVWKSASTSYRADPWQGDAPYGSCIELHLLQATESD